MNTLVLLGQKGGVGKTQIGQNLAVAACRDRKQRAVIIDTDAQTTARSWGSSSGGTPERCELPVGEVAVRGGRSST